MLLEFNSLFIYSQC